ncbi:helix-turn-helix domain-containing protein [Lacticaseibacillus jixiensis]|uniref:helix-turn-helix domain-containing protein n=1 Tax=Lacticaseibacillus jixiensis TaxID=3231926 RepID=UPI0036F2B95C
MNDGELIRRLRKARGLTQAQLSKDISSRSALASFELHNTGLPVQQFIAYCDRLNISLEEYEFLMNDHHLSTKRKRASLVSRGYAQPYDPAITHQLLSDYHVYHDYFFYSLYAQYYLVCGYRAQQKRLNPEWYSKIIAKDIKESITLYLERIDTWDRFELVLFYNCLFVFDEEYIRVKFNRCVQKMKQFTDNSNYSQDILNFLINGIQLAIDRHDQKNFQLFYRELQDTSVIYNDISLKLHVKVYRTIIAARQGIDVTDTIHELSTALNCCEATELQSFLEQQLN